jgi:hypothetical protein
MTGRRTVDRLYDELSPAEAYAAFLFAVAQGNWPTAGEVVKAMPSYRVVVERSELLSWHEGFAALVEEFDREVRDSLAQSEAARVAHQSSQLTAGTMASIAQQMYLSGVAAAAGDADSQRHQEKANDISKAVLDRMQPEIERSSEVEAAARQHAADLVHGFDGACQAAGIDPDVVLRGLPAIGVEVLDEVRATSPSSDSRTWLLCFAGILLDHVGDDALDDLAA